MEEEASDLSPEDDPIEREKRVQGWIKYYDEGEGYRQRIQYALLSLKKYRLSNYGKLKAAHSVGWSVIYMMKVLKKEGIDVKKEQEDD